MKKINSAVIMAVFGFGLVAALLPATNAVAGGSDDRTRLECRDFGISVDTSMDARFEARDSRRKLSISFEAGLDDGFADQSIAVTVKGMFVGNINLAPVSGGFEGDLNFDNEANMDDDDLLFPPDFPSSIGTSTIIIAGSLQCTLND